MSTLIETTVKGKEFQNWLRGSLAVLYAKEGLQEFVGDELTNFQQDLLTSALALKGNTPPATCNSCSTKNVLSCRTQNFCSKGRKCNMHDPTMPDTRPNQPCPNSICLYIRDGIRRDHRYSGPTWRNTDARRWCTDIVEVAKCYMAPGGYSAKSSLEDIDFNGIVSVVINNIRFQNKIDADLSQPQNICTEACEVGRVLRHSADLSVTDTELGKYMDTLEDLLSDAKYLAVDRKACEAVDKIKQLKVNDLTISTTDLTSVLDQKLSDLALRHQHTITSSLKTHKRTMVRELEGKLQIVKASLANVENVTLKSLAKIIETGKSALVEIDSTAKKSKQEITALATKEKRLLKEEIQQQKDTLQPKTNEDGYLKTCLQEDLVSYYRSRCNTIPISPLAQRHDVPLLDFYVQPPLTSVDVQRTFGTLQEPDTKVLLQTYRDLFLHSDGDLYKNIYITAKAGVGKTSFAKKLCMTWCQAHKPLQALDAKLKPEDVKAMEKFELLFLLPLRDVESSLCDLDSMILNEVVRPLARGHRYSELLLKDILYENTCLVVIDGLDEWSHPQSCKRPNRNEHEEPHNPPRERCTVIRTTRPWKLDVSGLRLSQIDRHIEISELDKPAFEQLATNAVTLLNDRGRRDQSKRVEDFLATSGSLKLGPMQYIPYILLQMIGLWFDEKSIGKSKCEIYSNILELTLSRGQQERPRSRSSSLFKRAKLEHIPSCLEANKLCQTNYEVLMGLGKVAFETLFGSKKEVSIVFDRETVLRCLPESTVAFCLEMGLLSQSKSHTLVAETRSKLSFQHKSVQEYFSALYIQSSFDRQHVQTRITQTCHSSEAIVEMSNVFVFLGGLNPDVCSKLFQMLEPITSCDETATCYRNGLLLSRYGVQLSSGIIETVKSLQNMKADIVEEVRDSGQNEIALQIQDIMIDSTTVKTCQSLKPLVKNTKAGLKSVSIRQCASTEEFTALLKTLDLHRTQSLQKLEIHAVPTQEDLRCLLSESVHSLGCLNISSGLLKDKLHYRVFTTFSPEITRTIASMDNLQAVLLNVVSMTHNSIADLMEFVSQRTTMTEIALEKIKCLEHKDSCHSHSLDLSQHQNLKTLRLSEVNISQFQVNTLKLDYCCVGQLPQPAFTQLQDCLQDSKSLNILWYKRLSSENVVNKMFETLPKLAHLRHLSIQRTDLHERDFVLSNGLESIEYIDLFMVTMSSHALESLVSSVKSLQQSVEIVLEACTFRPEERYLQIKNNLRVSPKYQILFDGMSIRNLRRFRFQTVGNKAAS